jgi:hypothetical protein
MHTLSSLYFPSDLPGVNPATLNGMILYYRLMTKWSGLGDSTELSRMGLSDNAPRSHGKAVAHRGGKQNNFRDFFMLTLLSSCILFNASQGEVSITQP